jgi:hypothetical protein
VPEVQGNIGAGIMIDEQGTYWAPCAWCGMDEMDEYADFNAKDVCVDCVDEALKEVIKESKNYE